MTICCVRSPTMTASTTTGYRNSRASAVEPPQGKRVVAHGACWRQLSRGPGISGTVRSFLLPQAGAGAQSGCQRERYAELNPEMMACSFVLVLPTVLLLHQLMCFACLLALNGMRVRYAAGDRNSPKKITVSNEEHGCICRNLLVRTCLAQGYHIYSSTIDSSIMSCCTYHWC